MLEVIDLEVEQRSWNSDAGIVDESEQRLSAECGFHLLRACGHHRFVGHVEDQRHEVRAELLRQPAGIRLFAHAAEHAETARDQDFRTAPANTSRRTGNDDGFHGKTLSESSMTAIVTRDR